MRAGSRLADARAVLPKLKSVPSEPEADNRALTRLGLWCGRYGLRLNIDEGDGLWIDVTGVPHLFGGEAALLQDLVFRLAGFGVRASVGLADTLGAAWALARYGENAGRAASMEQNVSWEASVAAFDKSIAPKDGTRFAMAHLPVEGLRLETGTLRLLHRLGLRRIGQLYDVPRVSLKRRFASRQVSEAVLMRLDQMLGVLPEPLKPLLPVPSFQVRQIFPEPLITSEALKAVLGKLLYELCHELSEAHKGALRAVLIIYRTDAQALRIEIGLSALSRTPSHFLQLFLAKLEAVDVGFGIDALGLGACAVERLDPQQEGLGGEPVHSTPSDELVDRLANRLGCRRIFQLMPQQSYWPERAEVPVCARVLDADRLALNDEWCLASRPPFLLPCPELIAVVAEVPDGPPKRFRWRHCLRRVARSEGPERIAPEWWLELEKRSQALMGRGHANVGTSLMSQVALARDYYCIEDEDGGRYWVFREGGYSDAPLGEVEHKGPQWYLHGLFA